MESERGPLLGVLKLGVYAHPVHSLLCQHDEPGYGQSFARIVKGVAGSLAASRPDPRAQARFAELSILRLGPLAVGYAEHLVTAGEGGKVIAEQFGAQLLPRGPADLIAIDSVTTESIDAQDLLAVGTYVHGTNGELDLTMTVTRGDDGRTYAYAGEKDGKKLEGRFETKQGLSTDLWFARRFAARATPAKGEVRHEMYSVETNPVAAVPVSYRLDPPGPRRATMELGPMRLSGDLDPHGLFRTAELPLGPATLVLTRVFERGTP